MNLFSRNVSAGMFVLLVSICSRSLYADVGLVLETSTGLLGFLSNVGHVSVWISHGCLGQHGEVSFCETSQGIVLTSTAYWPNPGAAAIPAELFFLGSRPGVTGRNRDAWNESLASAYPDVKSEVGDKYMGRVWRRDVRVLTFTTPIEEDREVLRLVEQQRRAYRYSYSHRNCAFYAEQVLKLYLGEDFHADHLLDFGIDTPRALERALRHRLESDPASTFRSVRFKDHRRHGWRQPPRNFCETAIFDPKYAVPLLMYQPYIYVGFGACYGLTRLSDAVWAKHAHPGVTSTLTTDPTPNAFSGVALDPHLTAFRTLTGPLPSTSLWSPSHTGGALPASGGGVATLSSASD